MTHVPLEATGSPFIFYCSLFLVLYGTLKAYEGRNAYRKLIAWGALADMGFVFMALSTAQGLAMVGALLFTLFQLTARGLALSAHEALHKTSKNYSSGPMSPQNISMGAMHNPKAAALFALGLLATVGGSPFLVPEGVFLLHRAFWQQIFSPPFPPLL